MKIEIVLDPSRPAPPASLVARVAPAPAAAAPEGGARSVDGIFAMIQCTNAEYVYEEPAVDADVADVVEDVEEEEDVARMKDLPKARLILMPKWRLVPGTFRIDSWN